MQERTTYRLISQDDSSALQALIAATPDAGSIGFTDEYQADLLSVHRALADDLHGAVALREGRVVGMALADAHPLQVCGEVREGAYLSHLRVHPDCQRQGIARALSDWGLEYLTGLLGPEVVPYAAIMQGNLSRGLVERYGFQATRPIQGGVVPVRRKPPAPQPGLDVRPARQADLPAIADGMNHFYQAHNLWSPVSAGSLKAFLERGAAGVKPNQLFVVESAGRIVAGLSLSDRTALVRMRITRAPWYLRALGAWLGVLPGSGVLRAMTVRRAWFEQGELAAGQYLWDTLRFQYRDRADGMGIAYDPRDRLAGVFRVPAWIPMFPARYLVRMPGSLEAGRWTYCIAGP